MLEFEVGNRVGDAVSQPNRIYYALSAELSTMKRWNIMSMKEYLAQLPMGLEAGNDQEKNEFMQENNSVVLRT